MKGHMQDGKFHPHTDYKKGVRKSRDQKSKQQGVKIKPRKQRMVAKIPQPDGTETVLQMNNDNFDEVTDTIERQKILDMMTKAEIEEWEGVVNSEIVKVKHEMLNGMPITTLRFANGEEWFEFESFDHQEKYVKKEKINVDENVTGEFVEIDHPDIAGYITMDSGSILFGEREGKRMKRDGISRDEAEDRRKRDFSKPITHDELGEEWWRKMVEGGAGFEVMMEGDVSANDTKHAIGKVKDGHDYVYWQTSPAWDEFSQTQKLKLIKGSGGIEAVRENLEQDGWISEKDPNRFTWEEGE